MNLVKVRGRWLLDAARLEEQHGKSSWKASPGSSNVPLLNVLESPTDFFITATAPGVGPEEIELEITDEGISIGVRRETRGELAEEGLRRQERWQGSWGRRLTLPRRVLAERVSAELANGVLVVRIPKSAAPPPRRVPVIPRDISAQ